MSNAWEQVGETLTGKVTTSGGQVAHTFCKLDTTNSDATTLAVTRASAATDTVFGVLMDVLASGARDTYRAIQRKGVARLLVDGSGASIAVGDRLVSNSAGKGVKASPLYGLTGAAIALQASTADDDVIAVLLLGEETRPDLALCKVIQSGGMAAGEICIVDATESVAGTIAVKDTAGDTSIVFGVLTAAAAEDALQYVKTSGIALVKVNGNSVNISAGDELEPAAAGVGIKAGAATTTAQQIFGVALLAATTDGALIPVLLRPRLNLAAA